MFVEQFIPAPHTNAACLAGYETTCSSGHIKLSDGYSALFFVSVFFCFLFFCWFFVGFFAHQQNGLYTGIHNDDLCTLSIAVVVCCALYDGYYRVPII